MYGFKKSFSREAKRDFARKMNEIEDYCLDHGISRSRSSDSYYFTVAGQSYRVSNHSVEASNLAARDDFGHLTRELYHPGGRDPEVVYIHASKTRLIEIHQALLSGKKLDGHGREVC